MAAGLRRTVLIAALALIPAFGALATDGAAQGVPLIRTVAGDGAALPGSDGGPATQAQLDGPFDVAVDAAGNLYISETERHRIRMVSAATGQITTVAGTGVAGYAGDGGPAVSAQFRSPRGLAVDRSGNLFIADTGNHRIRKMDRASGVIVTVAGDGTIALLSDAAVPAVRGSLSSPTDVAIDGAGVLYIADRNHHRVRQVAGDMLSTIAGNSQLNPLTGDAVCPISMLGGTPGSSRLQGGYAGDGGPAIQAQLRCPSAVDVDVAGNVFIADTDNHAVRRIAAPTGIIQTVAGGRFYVAPHGPFYSQDCALAGDGGPATAAYLCAPAGVAVDRAGNLYVADSGNHRVRVVRAHTGVIATLAGTGTNTSGPHPTGLCGFGGDDGPASSAALCGPTGVAVDSGGAVLVVDGGNRRARRVTRSDLALTGDIDGDGLHDLIVWRPTTATWYWLNSSAGYDYGSAGSRQWGNADDGDVPMAGDLDGDGKAELIVWRAATGTWYWLTSSSGYATLAARAVQWGNGLAGDVPLLGDMDGDGRGDLVLWRATTGRWYWLNSSSGYDPGMFGTADWGRGSNGDIPLLGDFDGDGRADVCVWRPSNGTWYWLTSSTAYDVARSGSRQWGNESEGDLPALGDFDGDRISDLAVWRAGSGKWLWLTSSSGYGYAHAGSEQWGRRPLGDVPMLAEMDGDLRSDLIVWRGTTATWYWISSSTGYATQAARGRQWGSSAPAVPAGSLPPPSPGPVILSAAGSGFPTGWNGGFGGDDGPALSARLNQPFGVAVDSLGSLYIADRLNHRVRKVTAAGLITTIAGSGRAGYAGDGGPAAAADLNAPTGVAVDGSGNVYVADSGNHAIRRIAAANATISTIAGTGVPGDAGEGGPAVSAQLRSPAHVAVDRAGAVYLTDNLNYRVKRIDPVSGLISTIAGTGVAGFSGDGGPAQSAELKFGETDGIRGGSLALDAAGNVFIADGLNFRIRRVAHDTGLITTVAGTGVYGFDGDQGPATAARLSYLWSLAVDASGALYIADTFNHRVRVVSSVTGIITTLAGGGGVFGYGGDGGPAVLAQLNFPADVAVGPGGDVYIADSNNDRVRVVVTPGAPAIVRHPTNRVAESGRTVRFSATASGRPVPLVQWQRRAPGGPWTNILDATASDFTLEAAATGDGSEFRAVFTNAFGVATTATARLTARHPVGADMDGDGLGDLIVVRPTSQTWFWLGSTSEFAYLSARSATWGSGAPDAIPLVGDVDGDGIGDPLVWEPAAHRWSWLSSTSGNDAPMTGEAVWNAASAADVPLLGDLDGDGSQDLVVWRAATGTFEWRTSSTGFSDTAMASKQWGNQSLGDVPVIADVDGDARGDLAVWRATTGTWFWLTSRSGYDYASAGTTAVAGPGDGRRPLAGDVDGDGRDDLALWQGATGIWHWLLSSAGYRDDAALDVRWGNVALGDRPFTTDLDGDRLADLVVWRASTGTWYWLLSSMRYSTSAAGARQWGAPTDIPVVR